MNSVNLPVGHSFSVGELVVHEGKLWYVTGLSVALNYNIITGCDYTICRATGAYDEAPYLRVDWRSAKNVREHSLEGLSEVRKVLEQETKRFEAELNKRSQLLKKLE